MLRGMRRGATAVQLLGGLVVLSLLLGSAVVAVGAGRQRAAIASMRDGLAKIASAEEAHRTRRGTYVPVEAILDSAEVAFGPDVAVDSSAMDGQRIYVRLRHRLTDAKCSLDLGRTSDLAINRRQCFGGPAEQAAEVTAPADSLDSQPVDPLVIGDSAAEPPAVAVLAPVVSNPDPRVLPPGSTGSQTFTVRNPNAVARSYGFALGSSNPDLAAAGTPPADLVIGAGATADVPVTFSVPPGAGGEASSTVSLRAEDLGSVATVGVGGFLVSTELHLLAPGVAAPRDTTVDAGATVALVWTVTNRTNGPRTLTAEVGGGGPELSLVAVEGGGTRPFTAGERREVRATFRVAPGSEGGSVSSAQVVVRDAVKPALQSAAGARVTTRAVVVAPQVTPPADRTEEPGSAFTSTWTVVNRSNQARTVTITPTVAGGGDVSIMGASGTGTVLLGRNQAAVVTVSYRVADPGVGGAVAAVGVTATDAAAGLAGSASARVTTAVARRAPALSIPEDQAAYKGEERTVQVSLTNRSNVAESYTLQYASGDSAVVGQPMTSGDGCRSVPVGGSCTWTHRWTATGQGATRVNVQAYPEGADAVGSASYGVSVPNRNPEATLAADRVSVTAGEVVSFTAAGTDPDGDGVSLSVDFGDGTAASGASHGKVYLAAGTYQARAVASDGKGGTGISGMVTVTVAPANHSPTVGLGASTGSVYVGDPVSFTASGSDPDGDPVYFLISFGDGTSAPGGSQVKVYAAPGTYVASATATDGRGGSGASNPVTVTVSPRPAGNNAPSAGLVADRTTISVGETVSFTASGSDPDGDPLTFVINFGDGAQAAGQSGSRTYWTPGTYHAQAYVGDGRSTTASPPVVVTVLQPAQVCQDSRAENYGGGLPCWYLAAPSVSGPLDQTWSSVGEQRGMTYVIHNPNPVARTYCLRIRSSDDGVVGSVGGDGPDACGITVGPSGSYSFGPHTLVANAEGSATETALVYDQARTDLQGNMTFRNSVPVGTCRDEIARNYGGGLPCDYSNRPPTIERTRVRNTAICYSGTGGEGWFYDVTAVNVADPDGDAVTLRWIGESGDVLGGNLNPLRSDCWLRAYDGTGRADQPARGTAYVEATDRFGGKGYAVFGYTPF